MPQIDVKTSDDDMVVSAEVPGINREDITVDVGAGVLTIKGESEDGVREAHVPKDALPPPTHRVAIGTRGAGGTT